MKCAARHSDVRVVQSCATVDSTLRESSALAKRTIMRVNEVVTRSLDYSSYDMYTHQGCLKTSPSVFTECPFLRESGSGLKI